MHSLHVAYTHNGEFITVKVSSPKALDTDLEETVQDLC
jgi:hypothetical protein